MRPRNIPESQLREMVKTMSFAAIAKHFGCDVRAIGKLAAACGWKTCHGKHPEKPGEVARIRELRALLWSVKAIADDLGRSQEFVARRIWRLENPEQPAGGRPRVQNDWPVRNTTDKLALKGQPLFDDVRLKQSVGEPVNGTRYARNKIEACIGTSAALCVEFA